MSAMRGDGVARAASELLLDRAHLLLPLAAQLGRDQPDFESSIHGSSMAPAIPPRSRIRVRPAGEPPCQVGDVVFHLTDGGYTVHRVVHRTHHESGVEYLLTEGDARFAPDAPVPCSQVLGTVVAVESNGAWRPVGPLTPGPWHRRVARAITLPLMILTMRFSVATADRLAALLLTLESRARVARRRLLRALARARFEAGLALRPVWDLLDRMRHRGVAYRTLDVARFNALFPRARRLEVARAIGDSLAPSDNLVYFRNVSWYNWCHRRLPRGIPALDDVYPPNVAVLDFLAHHIAHPEREVLLDFPCGIGALLVYARDLGLAQIYGFDNWTYLARTTAERFLERFGMTGPVLVARDDLPALPVTILACVGYPLPMLMQTSSVWANPSVHYVLADRMTRPMSLPGFRRAIEYAGLLTVFERVP
jgi:hypothetical protein